MPPTQYLVCKTKHVLTSTKVKSADHQKIKGYIKVTDNLGEMVVKVRRFIRDLRTTSFRHKSRRKDKAGLEVAEKALKRCQEI